MAFEKDTMASIKATARNLIAKHRRMAKKYGIAIHYDKELVIRHAIVTVNEKLSGAVNPWPIAYWGEVKRVIKSKL